jgi:hypothetical protein
MEFNVTSKRECEVSYSGEVRFVIRGTTMHSLIHQMLKITLMQPQIKISGDTEIIEYIMGLKSIIKHSFFHLQNISNENDVTESFNDNNGNNVSTSPQTGVVSIS